MSTFIIKQGDTSPAIEAVLKDNSGVPLELQSASVKFQMAHRDGILLIDEPAVIDEPEEGLVVYYWEEGDTNLPGIHYAEWKVSWDGGVKETFPNSGYIKVHISDNIRDGSQ